MATPMKMQEAEKPRLVRPMEKKDDSKTESMNKDRKETEVDKIVTPTPTHDSENERKSKGELSPLTEEEELKKEDYNSDDDIAENVGKSSPLPEADVTDSVKPADNVQSNTNDACVDEGTK